MLLFWTLWVCTMVHQLICFSLLAVVMFWWCCLTHCLNDKTTKGGLYLLVYARGTMAALLTAVECVCIGIIIHP